jgi:nucleoside phosphorylase
MWATPAQSPQSGGRRRQLKTRDYTVGWICALPIELAAAQEMLDEEHLAIHDHNDPFIYTLGRIHVHNVVLACLPAGSIGTQSAATVATRMKSRFTKIKFGLMVGIGGGVPSTEFDIRLGDVVVSHPYQQHGGVVQYDFGKTLTSGHIRTGWLNAPPPVLLSAIVEQKAHHIRRQSTLEKHLARFKRLECFSRGAAGTDVLFNAAYEHPGGPTCAQCSNVEKVKRRARRNTEVLVHYGTIASGNQVMKDAVKRDEISKGLGGVMCFEMEAAGLMNDFPCLVIRGICDYADSHKNKTWQPYAAATAAACAKEIMTIVPAFPEPTTRDSSRAPETGQTRVELKLDELMRELKLGYRPANQDVESLVKELVDDGVTEVDVEANRDFIDDWLRSAESEGWLEFEPSTLDQEVATEPETDPKNTSASKEAPQSRDPKQAYCESVVDEEADRRQSSDDEYYSLSDADTEVAEELHSIPREEVRDDTQKASSKLRKKPHSPDRKAERPPKYGKVPNNYPKRRARRWTADSQETAVPDRREADAGAERLRKMRQTCPEVPPQWSEWYRPLNPFTPETEPYRGGYGNYMHHDDHFRNGYAGVPPRYPPANPSPWPPGTYFPPPKQIPDPGPAYQSAPQAPVDYEHYWKGYPGANAGFGTSAPNYTTYPTSYPYDQSSTPVPNPYTEAPNPYNYFDPQRPKPHATGPEQYDYKASGKSWDTPNADRPNWDSKPAPPPKSAEDRAREQYPRVFNAWQEMKEETGRSNKPSPPSDVTIVERPLAVTLEEMFNGVTKKLKITQKTYKAHDRSESTTDRIIEVPVKRGLKAGHVIKLSGMGNSDPSGVVQDLHFILEEVHSYSQSSADVH